MSEALGWDISTVVVVFTALMVAAMPGTIVGGKLNDKFGSKWVLKVGGLAFGISVVASAFSPSAWAYVILSGCCAGFFQYVIYVAQLANKAELFPDRRGVALGLATAGMSLGTAFITPLAEWLTRVMPVMTGIALQGVVYGLLVIIAGFLIVEAPSGYKPANWIEPEMGALGGEVKGYTCFFTGIHH